MTRHFGGGPLRLSRIGRAVLVEFLSRLATFWGLCPLSALFPAATARKGAATDFAAPTTTAAAAANPWTPRCASTNARAARWLAAPDPTQPRASAFRTGGKTARHTAARPRRHTAASAAHTRRDSSDPQALRGWRQHDRNSPPVRLLPRHGGADHSWKDFPIDLAGQSQRPVTSVAGHSRWR
jgi:hypothetical protein